MNNLLIKKLQLGDGTFTLETGKMAKLADGAVLSTYGDTVVLAAASVAKKPREGMDFFPLTVDVEEKMYAAGKIPGGFIKREGRAGERSILTARLIDRPIRPLFPDGYKNDIQIVCTILSVEDDNEPDILAMNSASASLHLSSAPFNGPIGAVRVGYIDGKFIINPNLEQRDSSLINLTVAGTKEAVMMVEAGAKIVPEKIMLEAILFGHEEIKRIVDFIVEFRNEAEKLGLCKEKFVFVPEEKDQEAIENFNRFITPAVNQCIEEILTDNLAKQARDEKISLMKDTLIKEYFADKAEALAEKPELLRWFKDQFENIEKEAFRDLMLDRQIRIDNRKLTQVRPITCEVDILPRTHGSALFTRGETQVLSVVTLGPNSDEQIIDDINTITSKRYMHHYNFPAYSVGETRPNRGPGRREIGHGNLAERALIPVLPSQEDFPYVMRVVSEALSSNGSTSMGSVCGSSLSLMSAGVPILGQVSGIAMGLIKKGDKIAILTDIQGMEDHLGDMDFKVAGTKDGVTALQMDIKIDGINREILETALEHAKAGRIHIMNIMNETLQVNREVLSPYAPKIVSMDVDPDKIREIIGPGGKMIKKIIEETGVAVNIDDSGRVEIAGVDQAGIDKAIDIINKICAVVEIGKIYLGKVKKVTDFGAFVEVIEGVYGNSGREGLVHISVLDVKRVNKVEDIVKEGDEILVKAMGIDDKGRLKLSRKDAMLEQE
ncbi:MAG: polyribonucleotide nucleotidyltransferase [Fusobacteria bacterium]|nr:MAG: polyribonucleotide nucleotidyltransferase [Fusobacteriota bacterium]KAF0229681.1 MAG: polyribonucleotide [Fusobacteriota bacterium]